MGALADPFLRQDAEGQQHHKNCYYLCAPGKSDFVLFFIVFYPGAPATFIKWQIFRLEWRNRCDGLRLGRGWCCHAASMCVSPCGDRSKVHTEVICAIVHSYRHTFVSDLIRRDWLSIPFSRRRVWTVLSLSR